MTKVTLNEGEQRLADWMAKERVKVAIEHDMNGFIHGQQSDYDRHLMGAGGELAVAKYLNIFPETDTVYPPYPKFDLTTAKGKRLDIKTTDYPNGNLQVTKNKKIGDADYYVLVTVDYPVFNIVGYAASEDLIKEENLQCRNKKGLYSYWLNQDQLEEL